MNEDTRELQLWVESEDEYRWSLCEVLENELKFYHRLYLAAKHINRKLGYQSIDISNVNANEIYLQMREMFGNENISTVCCENEQTSQ